MTGRIVSDVSEGNIRADFETLLHELSLKLTSALPIISWRAALDPIVSFLAIDSVLVWERRKAKSSIVHCWQPDAQGELHDEAPDQEFSFFSAMKDSSATFLFESVEELPTEAAGEKELLLRCHIQSGLICPLVGAGEVFGVLVFAARSLSVQMSRRLELVSYFVTAALGYKKCLGVRDELRVARKASIALLPDAALLIDFDGYIQYANGEAAHTYGVDTPEDLIGRMAFDFLEPQDLLRAKAATEHIRQEIARKGNQYTIHRPDGSSFIAEMSSVLIEGTASDAEGILIVARDVTEATETARNLAESEARLRLISEQTLLGVTILQDDQVIYANKRLAEITGFSVDEIESWTLADAVALVHPDYRRLFAEQAQKKQHGEDEVVPHYMVQSFSKEGQPKWLEIFSKTVNFRGLPADLITVLDITDQYVAQIELERSEAFNRRILSTMREGIVVLDKSLRCVLWNHYMEELTGLTAAKVLGEDIRTLFTNTNLPTQLELLKRAIAGETVKSKDIQFAVRESGQECWTINTYSPHLGRNGRIVGVVVTVHDISERKAAELKEQRHREQLIHAQKLSELGVMAAGMAHEINNPNNVVLINAQSLNEVIGRFLPIIDHYVEEHGEFALLGGDYTEKRDKVSALPKIIESSCRRIEMTIKTLKSFINENPSTSRSPVDLNRAVSDAWLLCSHVRRRVQGECSLTPSAQTFHVSGVHQQLELVFVNLITNACRALDGRDGGIRVQVSSAPGSVQGGEMIRVDIMDEGKGIPEEQLPHLTTAFFTTQRDAGGTGLGLFVSNMIVAAHGGEMRFDSEVGRGTTVTVSLPVIKAGD